MQAKIIVIFLVFSLLLTGCIGQKNLQDLTYIIALGIDYDNKTKDIIIKALALDFTNVAKQEGPRPSTPPPEWIGEGKGTTVEAALANLAENSEPDLYLLHIRAVIITEKAVKNKFKEIIESIGRRSLFRLSISIFTTKQSLDKLFQTKALFYYPQIYSVFNKKKREGVLTYFISPKRYREFLSEYNEPPGTTYIPSLDTNSKHWREKNNKYPLITINGASFFENGEYKGFLPTDKILGIQWVDDKKKKKTYTILKDRRKVVTVKVTTSKFKIKVVNSKKPQFNVILKGKAEILENSSNLSEKEILKSLDKLIIKEIRQTYNKGLSLDVDIFSLGTYWFRHHSRDYLTYRNKNPDTFYLQKDSLNNIKVSVNIRSADNYKEKTHSNIFDTKSIYK